MSVACAEIETPLSSTGAGTAFLSGGVWRRLRGAHESRVDAWTSPHLERASLGRRHPVHDFLFEYYSWRPGQLRRWHPGLGITLGDADELLDRSHYVRTDGGVAVSLGRLKPERLRFAAWLRDLLAGSRNRVPFFGCSGLHEWAMVYRCGEVRHSTWPMRFPPAEIARIVESLPVRCSHHDAFRFFTPAARPLNKLQPTREAAPALEQSGCLHANMDLYKWSYKLAPFTPSQLVADAFELAWDIRDVDMRASPYDLSSLGFEPIRIESSDGRDQYESCQRAFRERSRPLRAALIALCDRMLTGSGS